MDDRENYHTSEKNYIAIRIPQVEANNQLKKLILAGHIDQKTARDLEISCFQGLLDYEKNRISLDTLVDRLRSYQNVWHGKKDDSPFYRITLEEKPWEKCPCTICKRLGIHVVLFRGSERNRSRGFHNLFNLRQQLDQATIN